MNQSQKKKLFKKFKTEKEIPSIPETELHRTRNSEGEKFYNEYKYIKYLGEGTFSKVKLVIKNNQFYAMKVIDKKLLRKNNKGFSRDENGELIISSMLEDALKEIAILKKCNHKNIIKLYEILYDDEKEKLYLILEYCPKGPLIIYNEDNDNFEINKNYFINKDFYKNLNNEDNNSIIENEIEKIKKDNYSEDEIRYFLRQIIKGVSYLHHNGIIHKDLKPDNILISHTNKIKITDFNVSSLLKDKKNDKIGKKIEGTLYFRAPETCISEENENSDFDIRGKPLDIWSIGIIAYILAYKKFPFNNDNIMELFDIIEKGNYIIPDNRMSNGFIEFLNMCLEKNPKKRASIWKLKKMKWINEKGDFLDKEIFPPKILVSVTEVKGSMRFFKKVSLYNGIVNYYHKKSILNDEEKKNNLDFIKNYNKRLSNSQKKNKRNKSKNDNYTYIKIIVKKDKSKSKINGNLILKDNENNIDDYKIKVNYGKVNPIKMNKSSLDNLINVIKNFDNEKYRSIDIKKINLGNKEPNKMNKTNMNNLINILNKLNIFDNNKNNNK